MGPSTGELGNNDTAYNLVDKPQLLGGPLDSFWWELGKGMTVHTVYGMQGTARH